MSQIQNCVEARYDVYLKFICPYDLTKHSHYIKYCTLYVWNKENQNDPDGEYEEYEPIRNGLETADYKCPDDEIISTSDDFGLSCDEIEEYYNERSN